MTGPNSFEQAANFTLSVNRRQPWRMTGAADRIICVSARARCGARDPSRSLISKIERGAGDDRVHVT
jgi:hypothetical protein